MSDDTLNKLFGVRHYDWGHPITTEQFAWAILKEVKTPVVGDLTTYSNPGYAIQYCVKDEVWNCLSSGEKRLVDIAWTVYSNTPHGEGLSGITGLDSTLRRKVWIGLGYLVLGRDIFKDEDLTNTFDWDKIKGGITPQHPL